MAATPADGAGSGSEAFLADGLTRLPVDLPPNMAPDALLAVLGSSDGAVPIDEARIRAPDASLILHIYRTLLTIPQLHDAVASHEKQRSEHERHTVDVETQLHEAERLQAEAEARAEDDRLAKQAALQEKMEISGQLAQVQGTLSSLQSSAESGTQTSAEIKGRLEQAEQEKRSMLELLEREKVESARRAEEIGNLTTRSREARTEINRLSTELQEAKSAEGTAKFRIQRLEQELTLKSSDATWAHAELTKSTEELNTHRAKMQGEVASLNTRLQQSTQEVEALQSKTSSLQSAYDSTLGRLDDTTREKSDLRQRLVEQEGAFKSEMATQQRLSGLVEQQKGNAERRLRDVEDQWENILGEYRDREESLREEVAREQELRSQIMHEKDDIQQALDRLAESVGIDTHNNGNGSASINANVNDGDMNGAPSTPLRATAHFSEPSASMMSPTAALASKVQKSGKSFTQVYAELARAQEELRREKLECNRLGNVLEQVMADLQERAPALQAQREETERLGRDLEEISSTLARACEERDVAERAEKLSRLEAEASQRENGLLNQQLSDLAQQVRELSREIILRDNPDAAADMEPDGSQIGPSISATVADITSTQSVISAELVTFRNLTDLVTQNERLLRVVRELGTKMESEESRYRADIREQESDAIEEAKLVISRLQEEIRSERTRTEGIRRERDMFRTLIAQGRGAAVAPSVGITQESNAAHLSLTNQYNQLQGQFDALRTETANDMERLKEEAHQARSEASRSALSAAREKAGRESVEERLANAQQTSSLERRELLDLQKRHSTLQESLTRQEIAAQSLSQQLVIAHSTVERLRNEVSNLAAERQLHKETTDRLMEEKQSAVQERATLSEMLRSSQSMQSEMERSSSDFRRRLEHQLEKSEEQCKDLRDRITKEEEAHRQTALRRDVETTDLRTRLDRVSEELAKAREDLAVAHNSVQHLTARSNELQKQNDSKDDKLAVYERRNTSSSASGTSAGTPLDREQQLQVEIADLKGELRGAQVEVEQAKAHIEQFKSIASANEDALGQLQTSYDEYKRTMDASVTQKDSELASLRERTSVLATELATAQKETSEERQEHKRQADVFRADKKTLEDALSEMTAVEDRARHAQQNVQEEVRRHVQRAQEAHARYEGELLAHAEDVKALTSAKQQLDSLRIQALEAQKARETAEGSLASSQDSWTVQRSMLEKEKDEQKRIAAELRGQNEALHNHLETLQARASEIRQAASAAGNVGDTTISSQSGSDELQDVIRYLRREKEIVDLQVELREQECARLRQSVEHTQRSLDEARIHLSQEREQKAGANASAKQHEELMEKINQLSILRESNNTLRDELERLQRRAQSLETRVESLTKELEPLREDVRVKTVELEACQNQLRLSQEDNKRWQGRTQSILQQYNRIDPDELKSLQEQKQEAEKALEEQQIAVEQQGKELEAARAEVAAKQGQFDRLRQQSIDRIRSLNQKINEVNSENEKLKADQQQQQEAQNTTADSNQESLTALHGELDGIRTEKQQLEERIATLESEKADLTHRVEEAVRQQSDGQQQQMNADTGTEAAVPANGDLEEAVRVAVDDARKTWEAERQELEEKHQATERREQMHLQKAKEFNTAMKTAQRERDELRKTQEESGQATTDGEGGVAALQLQQRIAGLEQQLEQANNRVQELEAAVAASTSQAGGAGADVQALQKEHETALREQEARLSLQFTERQKQAIEIAVNKARAAGAASGSEDVEGHVQERLKQFEDERALALQVAIETKEKELKTHYDEQLKTRYEAGKEEATLRNKLLIKTRDGKIEKLTAELNQLKGIAPSAAGGAPAANATAPAAPGPGASTRGGMPGRPAARPVQAAPAANQTGQAAGQTTVPSGPARGGAPTRGMAGRGGAAVNAQKRKIDQTQSPGGGGNGNAAEVPGAESAQDDSAAAGATGGLPKKPRPAGQPITIRGGAGGQRGGAANRGGRGGGAAGSS